MVFRETNHQEILSLSFLTHDPSLFQPSIYARNDNRRKVKYTATHVPLAFRLFLSISEQKVESVGRMCAYQEVK